MSATSTATSHPADTPETTPTPQRRNRLLLALGGVVLTAAAGVGGYWALYGARYVSTDNAYTATEIAQVTPSVDGTVAEVKVTDTQAVHQGDVLVVIDPTDARLALAQAEAELGRALRRVRGYVATDSGLNAQIAAREADEARATAQLRSAEADFERARIDLERREALASSGAVSGDELTRARNAYTTA
ncbi:MAG: HlyD family secretion protein, partial [Zoogloea sp.]|uniref:HlyD family secretion protein n=1 Tax=Zoogloea sp. TaxID=49181 RepID=UPI003F30F18F